MKTQKPILLIDMDGVIADFKKAIIDSKIISEKEFNNQSIASENIVENYCMHNPKIFETLEPIKGAINSINTLFNYYDIYFCSTPMYAVPESYKSKRIWLEKHFGEKAKKRLILTHRKDLIKGDILIDDRKVNGVENFEGVFLHYGSNKFLNWKMILPSLMISSFSIDIIKQLHAKII